MSGIGRLVTTDVSCSVTEVSNATSPDWSTDVGCISETKAVGRTVCTVDSCCADSTGVITEEMTANNVDNSLVVWVLYGVATDDVPTSRGVCAIEVSAVITTISEPVNISTTDVPG